MKNITKLLCLFLFAVGSTYAQQEKGIIGTNNWLNYWTEFSPKDVDYGEPTQILAGNITEDVTLHKRDVYLLLGNVFVTNKATLTIEPGTVIIGDFDSKATLTISKGSKLIAEGLETDPIVFTSNRGVKKSGDWGGIVILGDAPTNRFGNSSVSAYYSELQPSSYKDTNFGGENTAGSSGSLKFVRIEYAGKRVKNVGYFNGLLLAAVGSGTTVENVMVSHCEGDSFAVWGGNVDISRSVSFSCSNDDFKFNYGAQSKLTNSLAVRSPYTSSRTGFRCLHVASYDKKEDVDFSKKGTKVVAKNLTLLNNSKTLDAHIQMGLIREGVYVGYYASLDMNKSVISGFNPAVILDDEIEVNQANLEKIKFTDMYFNNCNGNIFVENNSNNEDLENWYGNSSFFNVYSKGHNSETFIDMSNKKRPDFRLRINKIIASSNVNSGLSRQ